jgi:hypothetical protein
VTGVVVGGAIGAAAAYDDEETTTTTTTTTTTGGLPCDATVTDVDGVLYYQCGSTYYVEAYGGSGPIYVPVSPPG